MKRREFLQQTGAATGLRLGRLAAAPMGVTIAMDPGDPVANSVPGKWAVEELKKTLAAKKISVRSIADAAQAGAGDLCIVVGGSRSPQAIGF